MLAVIDQIHGDSFLRCSAPGHLPTPAIQTGIFLADREMGLLSLFSSQHDAAQGLRPLFERRVRDTNAAADKLYAPPKTMRRSPVMLCASKLRSCRMPLPSLRRTTSVEARVP